MSEVIVSGDVQCMMVAGGFDMEKDKPIGENEKAIEELGVFESKKSNWRNELGFGDEV
jgi:hypothetical protein